jgi:hypothetical protein
MGMLIPGMPATDPSEAAMLLIAAIAELEGVHGEKGGGACGGKFNGTNTGCVFCAGTSGTTPRGPRHQGHAKEL